MIIKIFILGFLFAIAVLPLIDSIVSLIITGIETLKSYLMCTIQKNQTKIDNMAEASTK